MALVPHTSCRAGQRVKKASLLIGIGIAETAGGHVCPWNATCRTFPKKESPMTKPHTPEDIYLHQEIADIHCSPHEQLAACSVVSPDREKGTTTSNIWICPLDGTEPWQMTNVSANDTAPRWSPDGEQLAFISDRLGNNQIFIISRRGGEARQLGQLDGAALSCEWSPDGKRLALTCSMQVDSGLRGQRPAPDAAPPSPDAPMVAWKLPYKADGAGFTINLESHLFTMDASTG
nr:PD40 domain-containing protein [Pseudomonas sp.]